MRIIRIKIHNFRSILDEEFFLNDYSILVGENNSGKSNIISAIRIFYGDLKFNKDKDFPKIKNKDLGEESYVEIEFQLSDDEYVKIDTKYQNEEKTLSLRRNLIINKLYAMKADGALHDEEFYGAKSVSEGKLGKLIFIPSVSKADEMLKTTGVSPFRDIVNYVVGDIVEKIPGFEEINRQLSEIKSVLSDKKMIMGILFPQ